jgi:topoisomerase IA-like protein
MEDELDVISSRASAEAQQTWHEICRKCFDDITERSKPLNKQTKQTFTLADTADNILVFNTYGASIKSLSDGGFSKIRPEIELDLEKARRGEYTIAELIWREDNGCLGEYQGHPVYLKKGKFGLYAEYGSVSNKSKKEQKPQTISLTPLNKPANNILLEDVIRLIESKPTVMDKTEASAMFLPQSVFDLEENTVANLGTNRINKHGDKSSLRTLRSDLSIRKGKYGPYIFHQNSTMSKPKFYQLKPFKDKWESMSSLELIAAIENTYHISI